MHLHFLEAPVQMNMLPSFSNISIKVLPGFAWQLATNWLVFSHLEIKSFNFSIIEIIKG